jgi:hypothetical protein
MRGRASVHWTAERRAEFKTMWDAGKSRKEIGERFGISISNVGVRRFQFGLDPRNTGRPPQKR